MRTFDDWREPPPGYCETDLVEHCGGVKHEGNFVHTLTLTDIRSGWTECGHWWCASKTSWLKASA